MHTATYQLKVVFNWALKMTGVNLLKILTFNNISLGCKLVKFSLILDWFCLSIALTSYPYNLKCIAACFNTLSDSFCNFAQAAGINFSFL